MICLPNSVLGSGLDLNVERQTCGLMRCHAKDRHAPRQACIFAAHGVLAAEYISPPRECPSWGAQGQGLLLPGSVLRHGLCPVDLSGVPARHRVNLRARSERLYHMGFRCQTISRNTLANANAILNQSRPEFRASTARASLKNVGTLLNEGLK